VNPIEEESYRILRSRVDLSALPPLSRAVIEHAILATADFEFIADLVCDENALAAGVDALRRGARVVADAGMVAAGIAGYPVICKAGDSLASRLSRTANLTVSAAAIRLAFGEAGPGAIWVVGCAPTALEEIMRREVQPALVIGTPAGFVGAAVAKQALRASRLPALSNISEKGGPAVAAAAFNALLGAAQAPALPLSMHPYLLGLRLNGRRVLVIGGGSVANRRIPALLEAGAEVHLVSPEVTPTLEDLAAAGRIDWTRRAYRPGDCAGAWLVCAYASDQSANAEAAAEAEDLRIWCVRADDADASPAWTPASGTAEGVRFGVLTGSPRRSAAVRDAILRSGALAAKPAKPAGIIGHVAIVGGGPGDPGLITVRGRDLLAAADVVVTDRLAPRALLDALPGTVEIIDAAKIPYGRAMAQEHINQALIAHARQGKSVVRLKGGDPFVFGRGAEEVLACLKEGIPVTVVPGVTSATAVPASAGIPVTHRGVAQDFHVVSVHVPPGDERSTVDWDALAAGTGTLVLLMALERIDTIADTLIRKGRNPGTPVSVIADGTLPTQRTISSTLENVAGLVVEEGIRPPALVVIGDVVGIGAQITELTRGVPVTPGRQTG
jgi:uroporphyrin-III C-methyltransferase/precorrin-2 dehydrogenase/sirohydrochlorin ferrochelatase